MITVFPEKDSSLIKRIFEDKNIPYNEKSGLVSAKFGDEVLGLCLYYLDEKKIEILYIEPTDDIMLADGILRSALHVASERFIFDARYGENTDSEIFNKLGFIKNAQKRTLDIDKLFGGCHCQK